MLLPDPLARSDGELHDAPWVPKQVWAWAGCTMERWFMRRIYAGLICGGLIAACSWPASADESAPSSDLARAQLARVIAVLRLRPEAAGQSCLDALREVHQTVDQMKALQKKAKNPDMALAQDVLETDYENGDEICGADASRVCASSGVSAQVTAACGALRGSH